MMKLTALKIDPEFQGKIPPLTSEELDQLEKNIVSDGKVINPIIVWNGLIIDGHNRYAILQKHPDMRLPFLNRKPSPIPSPTARSIADGIHCLQ